MKASRLLVLLALGGCEQSLPPPAPTTAAPPTPAKPADEPHGMGTLRQPAPQPALPHATYAVAGFPLNTPPLAEGNDRELVEQHCSVCHATTYITMQPPLSREAWQATVNKMLQAYGARISDDVASRVVNYLAAHYAPDTRVETPRNVGSDVGPAVFTRECRMCHQEGGTGLAGVFPPLKGHAPLLLASPERRAHLIDVVLHGLSGEIQVQGQRYVGAMPSMSRLSDEEIAAVLNHVTRAWGNDALLAAGVTPIRPDEVGARRGSGQTAELNHVRRASLGL
ncbi:MAG: c-type cytochrome [Myxococcota bacterium]